MQRSALVVTPLAKTASGTPTATQASNAPTARRRRSRTLVNLDLARLTEGFALEDEKTMPLHWDVSFETTGNKWLGITVPFVGDTVQKTVMDTSHLTIRCSGRQSCPDRVDTLT
jgi:hypothetical protein